MSTTPTAPIADSATESVSKTKTLINRGVNFVKTHKAATIAVVALTGLVVANATVDKKAVVTLAPIEIDIIDAPSFEVVDSSN